MTQAHNPIDVIHQELMGQLHDIVRVCNAHDIPYNLMCGTLLGAVRHKGFIPWDDDVDLLMTREAFSRFEKVYPTECDPQYLLTYLDLDPSGDEPQPQGGRCLHGFLYPGLPAPGRLARSCASCTCGRSRACSRKMWTTPASTSRTSC